MRWLGHVVRRDEESFERQIMDMEVEGMRKRERPKMRWKDSVVGEGREKKGKLEEDRVK